MKKINRMCKNFLWGIEEGKRRMVYKSWESICAPREEAGMSIKEVLSWNKSMLSKWIWKLITKQSSIWYGWTTAYVLKSKSCWDVTVKAADSECWRGIMQVKDEILANNGTENAEALIKSWNKAGKFHVSMDYEYFRKKFSRMAWSNSVWDRIIMPKHSFMVTLAAQNCLATVDNMMRRGMPMVNRCILNRKGEENHNHLFFKCEFAGKVWHSILDWLGIAFRNWSLVRELNWMSKYRRKKHWKTRWTKCSLNATVYTIWNERNSRIFGGEDHTSEWLIRQIQYIVCVRLYNWVGNNLSSEMDDS